MGTNYFLLRIIGSYRRCLVGVTKRAPGRYCCWFPASIELLTGLNSNVLTVGGDITCFVLFFPHNRPTECALLAFEFGNISLDDFLRALEDVVLSV